MGGGGGGGFFFQAEDGIRDSPVTGVQTCALPIFMGVRKDGITTVVEYLHCNVIG